MKPHYYSITFLLIIAPLMSFPQTFDCDNVAFLTTLSNSGSSFYRLQATEGDGIQNLEPIFQNNIEFQIGCIGYSVIDEMVYGLDYNTQNLLRIDAAGTITNLGRPIGIDTTLRYQAGEIFPEGNDFFVVGRDETSQIDQAYYSINLWNLQARPVAFEGSINATIQDMAINPRDGAFFGYDSRSKKIVNIDFGVVSNFQFPELPEFFSSLFFDENFNLYAYGDRSLGVSQRFYAINKITSEVIPLEMGPLAFDADACGCAYRFDFFKTISPSEAIPCQEVLIEYSFENATGTPRKGLDLIDTLPEILTITDIDLGNPFNKFDAVVNSGIGTNILDLSNLHILLADVHTIQVKAIVDFDVSGEFYSQAVLSQLPLALNPAMISDDLMTNEQDDANLFKVINPANPDFKDSIAYNCDNTIATIYAPILDANAFLWSDGSAMPTLEVMEAGIYSVQMETACETYTVDIAVDFDREREFVDLGADLSIFAGQPFSLPFSTNIEDVIDYSWQAEDMSIFSCTRCENAIIQILEPTTITLMLTSIEGCMVEDEIFIEVLEAKSIFTPTAFSPNNDGINDVFFFQGTDALIKEFKIFDRWGNLVFSRQNVEVNDISVGWDGKFQGQPTDSGVYIWHAAIQYFDGTADMLSGTVGVVR